MFNADGKDLSAFDKSSVGNAALSHDLLGGFGCFGAGPVQDFFNWNIDAAINITRGDAADSQQGNEQAGGVSSVAGFFVQGVLRALHAAVGGQPVDGVSDPLVNAMGVVAEFGGEFLNGLSVRGFWRGGEVGGGVAEFVFGGNCC